MPGSDRNLNWVDEFLKSIDYALQCRGRRFLDVKDESHINDLLSEVAVRFVEKLRGGAFEDVDHSNWHDISYLAKMRKWVFRAQYMVANEFNRNNRQSPHELMIDTIASETGEEEADCREKASDALKRCTPTNQQILDSSVIEGLSYSDLSVQYGVAVGAMRQRVWRAMTELRQQFKQLSAR